MPQPQEQQDKQNAVDEYRVKMRGDYEKLFTCPEGLRVIEDLKKSTYFHTTSFNTDPGKMAYNEGARTVILHIIAMSTPEPEESKTNKKAIKEQ